MHNVGLMKSLYAAQNVRRNRIVKFDSNGNVVEASSASDLIIGCSERLDAKAGGRVDVVLSDIAEVEYGGEIVAGQMITADADGRAVGAEAGDRVIGWAWDGGEEGDLGSVMISVSVA